MFTLLWVRGLLDCNHRIQHRARKRLGEQLADYAAREYRIAVPTIAIGAPAVTRRKRSRSAGEHAVGDQSTAPEQPQADGVDGIMAQHDARDLGWCEPVLDARAAG